jgi:hypothetical protein
MIEKGGQTLAGAVRVKAYPLTRHKLVVVPVGTSKPGFTTAQLRTELNRIYGQAAIEWDVTIEEAMDASTIASLSQGIELNTTDYSEHMRAVWRAYVFQRSSVPGTTYMFVIPSFKDNPNVRGYMPLKSGYGFITPQTTPREVAHELGHGKFHLRHTFSNDNRFKVPQGTQNLMDYSGGTELWKYQWDYIHDPEGGWFLFEDVEEGMAEGAKDNIALLISQKAEELSKQLNTEVYAVFHISKCIDTSKSKSSSYKTFNNLSASDIELRKPRKFEIYVDSDYQLWTVLYFTISGPNSLNISTTTSTSNNFSGLITKTPYLGYSVPPFDRVIECLENQEGLDAFACNSSDEVFVGFEKQERVDLYIGLLLNSIDKCLEEQKNDKVGDQFYREFSAKATTSQESQQLRQIADVFNKMGEVLLSNNNPQGWAENGDFFRASFTAYKQLGYSFESYLLKINGYLKQYEQQKDILEKLTDNERIAIALNAFSDKEIEFLPLALRVRSLDKLSSERMRGNFNLFGNNEEFAALRLVKYIRQVDKKDLIGELKNNALLKRLDSEFDDLEFFGGDNNYGKLIDILDKYVLFLNNISTTSKATWLETLYEQNRIYNITRGSIGEKYISASRLSNVGDIGVSVATFEGFTEPTITDEGAVLPPTPVIKYQSPVNISFDTPVAVYHNDILKGVDYNKNGSIEIISALKLHYYLSCNKNENIKTDISVAIDVASLISGTAVISGGVKGVRLVLAVFDVASSITSLMTTAVEKDILRTYGTEGQAYINSMRTVSAILGFADLGGQGVLKFKNLLKDDIITISRFYKNLENQTEYANLYRQSKKLVDDAVSLDDEIGLAVRSAGAAGDIITGAGKYLDDFVSTTGIKIRKVVDNDILTKAKQWQGKGDYPGIDDWEAYKIPAGTKIYGGLPGQSEFYSTLDNLQNMGFDKAKFWESLQVKPHPINGFRPKVGEYVTKQDITVAISKTLANPQFGKGGAWQIFVEEFSLNLEFVKEIPLK